MQKNRVEENILLKALTALTEETGLIGQVFPGTVEAHPTRWDKQIIFTLPGEQHEFIYYAEIKKRVLKEATGVIGYQFKELGGRGILVTEYVSPLLATTLKTLGIQFIDTCGNAYLNDFPLYIFVKGNKQVPPGQRFAAAPKAFKAAGLKVLFMLLCKPGFEEKPFREIATAAGVALGTVNTVFNYLKNNEYLIDKGRQGRKLLHKEKLLTRWITAYPEELRPKLKIGRYTAKDVHWWKDVVLPDFCYWGGEIAAAKITEYLKPEIVTMYTHEHLARLFTQNKIRKNPNGKIEILEAFWGLNQFQNPMKTVPPLLIYADLVATTDARNHETAQIIFNDKLHEFIRKT